MTEVWKTIENFPCYEVSDFGNIRSIAHKDKCGRVKSGHILKPHFDGKGNYLRVNLYKNGKMYTKSVHKLVAIAFVDNPDNYEEVNHKDEEKTNNAASNLEWCTRVYNNNYGAKKDSYRGEKNPMHKIDENAAIFIFANHKCNGGTMKNNELAKMFDLSATNVSAIAHGRRWQYTNDHS